MSWEDELASILSETIKEEMDNYLLREIEIVHFLDSMFEDFTRRDFSTRNGYDDIRRSVSLCFKSRPNLWTGIIDKVWFGDNHSQPYARVIHDDKEFFELIPSHVYRQQLEERYDADFYALIPPQIKDEPEFKRFVNVLKLKHGDMK